MKNEIGRRKVYVKVIAEHELDGSCFPRIISFADGRSYMIEKVTDIIDMRFSKDIVRGIRYTVIIGGREAYLYDERTGKWYVREKVYSGIKNA